MPRQITSRTTLENLKKEAKRWLKALHANAGEARARLQRAFPNAPILPTLRDVQHALALEHGLPGWTALKNHIAQDAPMRRYDKVADALVTAYRIGEESAMRIVWDYFGHMRVWDAMRRYVRLDLGKTEQPQSSEDDTITLAEAQYLVARFQGFENWESLAAFAASVPIGKATFVPKSIAVYSVDDPESKQAAARSRDWEEVIAVMQERQLPGLHASGQMTDALLGRVSRLDHLTVLDLEGSKSLTDDGVRHLSRLPRLRHI